ncbi:fructose-6-phosphate aldolase [bacterium]|nr:fructose-6-phosphate aldolase [bacterium]
MDFFLDTADIAEIKQAVDWGVLDGVTTNPTLVARTGKSASEVIPKIMKLVDGPVSLEVISDDTKGMLKEAEELIKYGENVVIKIPMTENGMVAVKELSGRGIPVNVTLIFSAVQALIAAKAGATYVSPFLGRLDDIAHNGLELVEQIITIFDNYDIETQVLAASLRHPMHVIECAMMGADVATLPMDTLAKLFKHPLTDIGVERFKADFAKIPKDKKAKKSDKKSKSKKK